MKSRSSRSPRRAPAAGARDYGATLAEGGFRFTSQRRVVFDAVTRSHDLPTALAVFIRAKKAMPSISLATVYNCLETMAQCGLVRQVHVDREASRFCANREAHAHFVCGDCGRVEDAPLPPRAGLARLWHLPPGYTVTHSDISLRGVCPACARRASAKNASA